MRILVLGWVISGLGGWYWYFMFSIGQPWRVAPPNIAFGLSFVVTWILLSFTNLGLPGAVLGRLLGLAAWLVTYEANFRSALRSEMRAQAH